MESLNRGIVCMGCRGGVEAGKEIACDQRCVAGQEPGNCMCMGTCSHPEMGGADYS